MSQAHKDKIRQALLGNKNGLNKNLGNKNALGKNVGEKNGVWKGGVLRGMTLDRKERIAGRKRPNLCEVCEEDRVISFDHDHKTGKFRGWICRRCNMILGFAKDEPVVLIKLLKYLDVRNNLSNPQDSETKEEN